MARIDSVSLPSFFIRDTSLYEEAEEVERDERLLLFLPLRGDQKEKELLAGAISTTKDFVQSFTSSYLLSVASLAGEKLFPVCWSFGRMKVVYCEIGFSSMVRVLFF